VSEAYTPDPRGLYNKYAVCRQSDTGAYEVAGPCFVLRPQDPHARVAMVAYALSIQQENPELASDLIALTEQHADSGQSKSSTQVFAAGSILLKAAHEMHAGQMNVVSYNKQEEPIGGVFTIRDADLTRAILLTIEQFDEAEE
jgi:hypothetical protein